MKDILQDKETAIDTYDMLMKSDMGKAFPDIARILVRGNRHVVSIFDENIHGQVNHENAEDAVYARLTTREGETD